MEHAPDLLSQRFQKDSLIALATIDGNRPSVRTVNAYYENGAFYIITYALSGKILQAAENPEVAVCGEWFTGHGIAKNLSYILAPENAELHNKLRSVFSSWYHNGHINEEDVHTCILKIQLTDGTLFANGSRYDLRF